MSRNAGRWGASVVAVPLTWGGPMTTGQGENTMYRAVLCSGPHGWWSVWVVKAGERLPAARFETGAVAEAMGEARRHAAKLQAAHPRQERPAIFLVRCRHAYECATGGPMCHHCYDPARVGGPQG